MVQAPNGSAIRARGFGASQRLPGYDDGGNYEVNRRVEVKLTY
jgi:flagellar motor protein MotB